MLKIAVILFLVTLFVYSLNFSRQSVGDTIPARLLPFNIFMGNGIYFDQYAKVFPPGVYFFQISHNHYLSTFPLLPGILSLPFFVPFYLYLLATNGVTVSNIYFLSFDAEKWSASIFASISVVIMFVLLRQLSGKNRLSAVFALIFAFATQTFSITSQHLWQHGFGILFVLLSQISLIRGFRKLSTQHQWFIVALIFALLSMYCRLTFGIYTLLVFAVNLIYDKRRRLQDTLVLLIGIGLLAAFNYALYQSVTGSFGYQLSGFQRETLVANIAGLIFSPAKGLLFYMPLLIFSLIPITKWTKLRVTTREVKNLLVINTLFVVAVMLMTAAWGMWFGGYSFGPRDLTDGVASVIILCYFFYQLLKASSTRLWTQVTLVVFVVIVAYSVVVQIIGVFFYPRGRWDEYPLDVDRNEYRLWDFQDNPLVRNLAVGPNSELVNQVYYRAVSITPQRYPLNTKCALSEVGQKKVFGYDAVTVILRNTSDTEWITGGFDPIYLGQIYASDKTLVTESPIPSTELPPVIKPGEQATADVILIPPSDNTTTNVIITPKQEHVGWWLEGCSLIIDLKRV